MEKIYSRFQEWRNKPQHLNFDANIGDVISMGSIYGIVTDWGIYNNQMWIEKIYNDGLRLGAANYEQISKRMIITDKNIILKVNEEYKNGLRSFYEDIVYKYSPELKEDIEIHLKQF